MFYTIISSKTLHDYLGEKVQRRRPAAPDEPAIPGHTGLINLVNNALKEGGTPLGGVTYSEEGFHQAVLMPE